MGFYPEPCPKIIQSKLPFKIWWVIFSPYYYSLSLAFAAVTILFVKVSTPKSWTYFPWLFSNFLIIFAHSFADSSFFAHLVNFGVLEMSIVAFSLHSMLTQVISSFLKALAATDTFLDPSLFPE